MTTPGWYYAEGDPPGTQRFWNGHEWQSEPVPVAPMGHAYGRGYPESSQATTVLVLGILGIVVCGLCAPFAWHIGNQEIAAIDAGRRDPSNRSMAQIGRVLGIVISLLMILGLLAVIVLLFAAAAGA